MRALLIVTTLAALACSPRPAAETAAASAVDRRIDYYRTRVAQNPRLYPVWIQLGDAYLDKAKETSDPSWLARAHAAAARSMAIQETYAAYHLKARLAGHAHRFEESLAWARKAAAAAAMPPDYQMLALEVEALVGMGRLADAKALLPADEAAIDDFFVAAALARVANEEQRLAVAAKHYARAGVLAQALGSQRHVAWAEAMVGGMLADSGSFAAALPHLDKARALGGCTEEAVHRAEVLAGLGRGREALAAYGSLVTRVPDPSIHHAAFQLAEQLGDTAAAAEHYRAAERGYRSVLAAGEVYTLGALAQLLLDGKGDANEAANEALQLARRNLEHKRDREAVATLHEAQQRVEGTATATATATVTR
jgi:hypothetical protein